MRRLPREVVFIAGDGNRGGTVGGGAIVAHPEVAVRHALGPLLQIQTLVLLDGDFVGLDHHTADGDVQLYLAAGVRPADDGRHAGGEAVGIHRVSVSGIVVVHPGHRVLAGGGPCDLIVFVGLGENGGGDHGSLAGVHGQLAPVNGGAHGLETDLNLLRFFRRVGIWIIGAGALRGIAAIAAGGGGQGGGGEGEQKQESQQQAQKPPRGGFVHVSFAPFAQIKKSGSGRSPLPQGESITGGYRLPEGVWSWDQMF